MVSRTAQAPGNSAAVGLRSSLDNPLPADGRGCLASVAAANPRRCAARIGSIYGAIDPQWTLVFCLFRSAQARSGTGRNHRFAGRHRRDCHAIRGIFTPGVLADDTLRRLGALCLLPELRNLAPK